MKEQIICAAVKYDTGHAYPAMEQYGTGFVIAGFEHLIVKNVASIFRLRDDIPRTEGFITTKNRFVDRREAAKIAYESGQIEKPTDILYSFHLTDKY